MGLTIQSILAAHAAGKKLTDTIEETYARIVAHDDPALFITLRPKAEALALAAAMQAAGADARPLFGVPFVVKDNIDVAGLPTTAACAAFTRHPERSAFVVERLEQAGAIVIGKTNLDQFATGLVGVRSPYGVPRNALRADLIPGGSSSGSATAVGAGLMPVFARHRHRGLGPGTRRAQRHCRPEADARRVVDDGRRARLPHARYGFDLRARCRRRLLRLSDRGGL